MKENEIISRLSVEEWQRVRAQYHLPHSPINREVAAAILEEVDSLLTELGLPFYLTCGTALGFYRDGDFIEWDDEIDMEILAEVMLPAFHLMQQKFLDNGFIVRATPRGLTSKMGIFKNGIKVALSAMHFNPSGFRCDSGQQFPARFYIHPEKFFFKNGVYSLPGPIEEYLEFYYGDWKTPLQSYDPLTYLHPNHEWKR